MSAFVAELRSLAEHCKFGANLDEMIRDRLVCGIKDPRIQRRLLQEPDSLTYESAYKLAIAMETASKDVLDLQKTQTEQSTLIQKVDQRAPKPPRRNPPSCYRCNGQHLSTECRFRSVVVVGRKDILQAPASPNQGQQAIKSKQSEATLD